MRVPRLRRGTYGGSYSPFCDASWQGRSRRPLELVNATSVESFGWPSSPLRSSNKLLTATSHPSLLPKRFSTRRGDLPLSWRHKEKSSASKLAPDPVLTRSLPWIVCDEPNRYFERILVSHESLKSTAFPGKRESSANRLTFADGADLWWTFNAHNARLGAKMDTFERETGQTGLAGGAPTIRTLGRLFLTINIESNVANEKGPSLGSIPGRIGMSATSG